MRYIDAIYKDGHIELMESLSLPEGVKVKVIIPNEIVHQFKTQRLFVKELRGKYKGSLSSSEVFSQQKAKEKALER
jgi:predicted DNA-binding antitoxin AbrB/MazE fold protein